VVEPEAQVLVVVAPAPQPATAPRDPPGEVSRPVAAARVLVSSGYFTPGCFSPGYFTPRLSPLLMPLLLASYVSSRVVVVVTVQVTGRSPNPHSLGPMVCGMFQLSAGAY
jgi:hypothetical protein